MTHIRKRIHTIGGLLDEKAALEGSRPFVLYKDKPLSLQALLENANRVANALMRNGLQKGDNICTMLPNCLESLNNLFGFSKAGVVEVPINTAYRGELLQYIINNCGARFMILENQFLERIKFIERRLEKLETLMVLDLGQSQEEAPFFENLKMISYEEEISKSNVIPPPIEVNPTDLADIMYTSGTTGPSKGVMQSNSYWVSLGYRFQNNIGVTSDSVIHVCLPLFHNSARVFTMMALAADATISLFERFSATRFWDECRRYNVTMIHLVSSAITMLYNQPPRPDDADNPVQTALFAATPPAIHDDFEKRFGVQIQELWGMTESPCPLLMPPGESRIGSCGKTEPGWDIRLFDSDDNEVEPGEVGEIVVRPLEAGMMFDGYYKMPEKTLEVFRNLWFHTGDLAKRDEDGYFYFVDRKKDAIRRRGENISSFEVEKVINSHSAVLESAAFAAPSELGEDEVIVVVVLREGQKLTPEELLAHCEERMAYFAIPRYVEYANSLPKTQTGRIEKYKLKEKGIKENTWDREKVGYKLKR